MRGYYFSAELSAWTETGWSGGELTWFTLGRGLHLLTPSLREYWKAFRQWLLTFHWFYHMSLGMENWSLTNCISAANNQIRKQCAHILTRSRMVLLRYFDRVDGIHFYEYQQFVNRVSHHRNQLQVFDKHSVAERTIRIFQVSEKSHCFWK